VYGLLLSVLRKLSILWSAVVAVAVMVLVAVAVAQVDSVQLRVFQ
jgi:hypothetical protein